MIQTQFTLYLENRPGALAEAARVLSNAKINIEGLSAATSADVGLVQVVSDNKNAAAKLLREAGIPFTEQQVAVVRIANQPGALAELADRFAAAGVNINYIYGTACSRECDTFLVISAEDLDRLEAILEKPGATA